MGTYRWALVVVLIAGVTWIGAAETASPKGQKMVIEKITKTDAEWHKILTPEQYEVTRHGGTECAFRGKYWNNHDKGIYHCIACDLPLFEADSKFESGTGWPSFWRPIDPARIVEKTDRSLGMARTEIL